MPTIATADIAKHAVTLHNKYLKFRNENVPFPAESVSFWCFLLAIQNKHHIEGNLLELGVQYGGTAFLSSLSCIGREEQILVDITKTSLFEEKFALLPTKIARRIKFVEA
jgi:hypothetical protein